MIVLMKVYDGLLVLIVVEVVEWMVIVVCI